MQKSEERGVGAGVVIGAIGGSAFTAILATLLAAKPAQAAPLDEKLDYLLEVLTTLIAALADLSERQTALTQLLEQWLAAQGVPGVPGVEVTVVTPWVAREPEQIFSQALRSAGVFYSDRMVNWTEGKRILFKAESSLNQAVTIQPIGNISDDMSLAVDINGALPLAANANLSVGLAWDDWHPYVGIKITVGVAPTAGLLTISAIVQE